MAAINPEELKALRNWFEQFDADLWDRQIEADAKNGKLRSLAERALHHHKTGRSTSL